MAFALAMGLAGCSDGTGDAPSVANETTGTLGATAGDQTADDAASEPVSGDEPAVAGENIGPAEGATAASTDDGPLTDDEAAARDVVTGVYDAWMSCSGDPSACDPGAAFGAFAVPGGQAYNAWVDQATRWQATSSMVSVPAGSDHENFSTVVSATVTGDDAVVVSCVRDVRAEYTVVGEGRTLVDGTDNPADYLVQYKLERSDGSWRITSSTTLETASLATGKALCQGP